MKYQTEVIIWKFAHKITVIFFCSFPIEKDIYLCVQRKKSFEYFKCRSIIDDEKRKKELLYLVNPKNCLWKQNNKWIYSYNNNRNLLFTIVFKAYHLRLIFFVVKKENIFSELKLFVCVCFFSEEKRNRN